MQYFYTFASFLQAKFLDSKASSGGTYDDYGSALARFKDWEDNLTAEEWKDIAIDWGIMCKQKPPF